jgi:hypothetical protein
MKYHLDYGLTDDIRLRAVSLFHLVGAKKAALICRVSVSSVYRWARECV